MNQRMNIKHKKTCLIGFGLLMTGMILLILLLPFAPTQKLYHAVENHFYDIRLKDLHRPLGQAPVAILAIDQKSIEAEGAWPWSRYQLAKIIDRLHEQKVSVIGFDMNLLEGKQDIIKGLEHIFSKFSAHQLDQYDFMALLENMGVLVDNNQLIAETMRHSQIVLGSWVRSSNQTIGEFSPPFMTQVHGLNHLPKIEGYEGNIPVLQQQATGGILNLTEDKTQVVRTVPLLYEKENDLYANFALEMARSYLLTDKTALIVSGKPTKRCIQAIRLDKLNIPTQNNGEIYIPYRGGENTIKQISATDLLHGDLSPETLKDYLVIIGLMTPDLGDFYQTPLSKKMSRAEIHAQLAASLIEGYVPHLIRGAVWIEGVVLLLVGIILSFIMASVSVIRGLAYTLGTMLFFLVSAHLLWVFGNLYFPIAWILILIVLVYVPHSFTDKNERCE